MRAWLEKQVMAAWQQRGWLAYLCWPLAQLFRVLIQFRMGLFVMGYKPQTRLTIPVIVVGNIFVGGTGKTPLVIWLVQQLQAAGLHPAVVSRGYGAAAQQVLAVDDKAQAAQVGDEPLLIRQRCGCPVMVGRDRVAAAKQLLLNHPEVDVLISDDGLQHYYLARDLEIVLFDQRGAGNGWLMPAGPLREPVSRRRDFTVLNAPAAVQSREVPGIPADAVRMQLLTQEAWQLSVPEQRRELTSFAGQRVCAAAGIGHPERFFQTLTAAGCSFERLPLADHQVFDALTFSQTQADYILITEKDAVKCSQIPALQNDNRIWVLPVEAQLSAGFAADLLSMILEKKRGSSPA